MGNFSIALSGLNAQASALNIVSDNLANLNTTGFKEGTASFQDLVTEAMSSSSPNGAGVSSVLAQRTFSQGSIQVTSGAFDAAIEGSGFFVVQNAQGQQFYTRAGNFSLDTNGNLVDSKGDFVLGWTTPNGVVNASGAPGKITVPAGSTVQPSPTTQFSIMANLNAAALTTDATGSFSTPVQVIDSLGEAHTLSVTFTKTASNTWDYAVTVPSADLTGGSTDPLAKGTLTFDSNGQLKSPAPPSGTGSGSGGGSGSGSTVDVKLAGLADGASDLDVTWNLYATDNSAMVTQFAAASAVSATNVDGVAAAQLSQVSLADGGNIVAQFSNGKQQVIGQLALANIPNPSSLIAAGANNFTIGANTGTPTLGAPQTGGLGQIKANALEASNVDIATEFTKLMTYQRSYEANSRTITTLDQMAQDLMQMKQ